MNGTGDKDEAIEALGIEGDIDEGLAEMLREKYAARAGEPEAGSIRKPSIDHLPAGVVSGAVHFAVGDRVVVERHTSLIGGSPWLDTKVVVVTGIDTSSGLCRGVDVETKGYVNFSYSAPGYTVKLPSAKKRAAKRVEVAPGVTAFVVEGPVDGEAPKKKRGRPKGSKNRPRDEIVAERAQKSAQRAAKKIARAKRGRK